MEEIYDIGDIVANDALGQQLANMRYACKRFNVDSNIRKVKNHIPIEFESNSYDELRVE